MTRWGEAFAGAGLGLLVGLLMGLSAASVVGGVVAALAAFFGLVPTITVDRSLRIGAFGLACAIGVLGGLMVRTGSAGLAPSVRAEVEAWKSAGYPEPEARALVAFQRLGLRPAGREVSPMPKPGPSDPVLFSSSAELCGRIARLPDSETLLVLRGPAAGPIGAAMAAAVDAAPETAQPGVLRGAIRSLCG